MNIMGVDLSTKAVTAVMLDHEENLVDWWHYEFKGTLSLDRATALDTWHKIENIPWHQASIVCFERPNVAGAKQNVGALMDYMRIEGMCIHAITTDCWPLHDRPEVWEMVTTDWKKKVGLPGNASKEEIGDFFWTTARTQALAAMDPIRTPQDFYDAYCVALAAVRENAKGL